MKVLENVVRKPLGIKPPDKAGKCQKVPLGTGLLMETAPTGVRLRR